SVTLEVREQHALVTNGVYSRVRHPMYSAFWLWALAQALLLPNWIAGPAGLIGFGTLFFLRVGREEALMIETFGDEYRRYMARTSRVLPGIYWWQCGAGAPCDRAELGCPLHVMTMPACFRDGAARRPPSISCFLS